MAARKYRKLTEEETAALAEFRKWRGKHWRRSLRRYWAYGVPAGHNWALLALLQGSHGAKWLTSYRIESLAEAH